MMRMRQGTFLDFEYWREIMASYPREVLTVFLEPATVLNGLIGLNGAFLSE